MKRSAANKKGGNVLPTVISGGGGSLKALLLASLAGCIVIGAPSASAAELSDVDLSKKPLDTPTLDYLNQNNVTLPAGDDGVAAPVPPSAYTLTKVDAAGENTITKFEWDESTQSFNPVYYNVNLKQTEYGEGSQTHTVTLQNTPLKDVTINVHYDEPDVSVDTSAQNYDNVYKDQTTNRTLTNPSSSSDEHYQLVGGAVKDADFSGSVLFENNTLNVTNASSVAAVVDVLGGAVYNDSDIENITGTFVNNSINAERGYSFLYIYGGALNNSGTIDQLNAVFANNSIKTETHDYHDYAVYGGALSNSGIINELNSDFINNSLGDVSDNSYGGAIYNAKNAVIGNIGGNFINNTANGSGGGIHNAGTIEDITGDFVSNTAGGSGGGIHNAGTIEDITGDFVSNTAISGGGILSAGTITNLTADFVNNNASRGGAIYNNGELQNVTADFINNTADAYGGAIYNGEEGDIGNITGTFIGNSSGSQWYVGGTIYNSGELQNVTADFINNSANSGGAIYNDNGGDIGIISGDFIANSADNRGGAIYNSDIITNLIGDFIENTSEADGGAIHNYGTINNITGDFLANSALNYGGAIYNNDANDAFIGTIKGDFIGNSAQNGGAIAITAWSEYYEGAIVPEYSRIDNVQGNFLKNLAKNDGGAIYNSGNGTIGSVTGDFYLNSANNSGGAIYNTGTINVLNGDFINNSANRGGAIYNGGQTVIVDIDWFGEKEFSYSGNIGTITGNFVGNYVEGQTAQGGAIWNGYYGYATSEINNVTGTLANNYAKSITGEALGGAIYNEGIINDIKGDFVGNYVEGQTAQGGAIWNGYYGYGTSEINNVTSTLANNYAKSTDGNAQGGAAYNEDILNFVNSSFINNYAKSVTGEAQGGALYSKGGETTISATDGYVSRFEGNTTDSAGKIEDNAICLDTSTLNFEMKTGGKFLMKDSIKGKDYNVNITGDDIDNTRFYMHNDIDQANLTLANTTIDTINNQTHVYKLNSLTVNQDTNFVADVDLQKEEMDRIESNSYGTHQGNLIVSGMNLLSDAPEGRDVTEIYFAQPGLKDNVLNGVSNGTGDLPDSNQTTFYTPIYKYNAVYDNRDDAGYFVFTKGDKIYTPTPGGDIPGGNTGGGGSITDTGNPSDAFNPAVLTTPVANQAASQAAMTEAFKYVFEHADAFTQLPATERMSYIRQNQYALSTDYNDNLGTLTPEFNNKAGWVRPYVTFENMHLKNGPKVDAITYGTLVGFDTDFQDLKRGWYGMTTGYVGYNGSQLSYSGVDGSTNGGLLGVTQTFYKGNFWTALTASAGASVGEAQTMYGSDDFTTLLAGVASKTGYNFEFKEGKFIIQPIMYISYTFANTFDYTNAAGVKIENNPMHTLQLHPQVRFIMNTENNWQPYISAGVVWNPFTSSKSTANGIVLPEMSMKPYAEYGIGIQKRWADKYTAFGQAMVRSGGRNGVALTFGFRWNIGKDNDKQNETEQVKKPERKIIKQASK